MIDAKIIRDNSTDLRQALANRGSNSTLLDEFLVADKKWRDALQMIDALKMKRNQLTPNSSSQRSIVTGRVAPLELVENANNWAGARPS